MTPRPLRKDAELNRDRLLEAARELFAKRGLGVGLNEIARRAGVGVGTAYRHFPDKEQLIDTLFEQRLCEIVALASEALGDPDAWRGLGFFLDRWLRLHLHDRGLTQVFTNPELGPRRVGKSRDRIAPLLDAIADRAREQGHTRPDFRGTDVFFIQLTLAGLMDRSLELSPDLYRRYLAMILDGARARPDLAADLPVSALTVDQTHAVMTSRGQAGAKRSAQP
ncbi:TetR/AcrR family transcriptional regulator [Streptomyces sp. NPDC090088]|uniref:TetR/AcrR family transcriptional regulator n=1 Tax=Streptomyces sp. NPDC090088 TaxID=3365944 RepID=UPI00381D0C71